MTLLYLKNLITDKHIASITPTSRFGVKRICSKIDFNQDNIIIEFGPATGVFTKFLLQNISHNSKLILIEQNQYFVSFLKKHFRDSRVIVYHESAENVAQIASINHINYIISGIPFSFIPQKSRNSIIYGCYSILKKGGKFLAYQTFFQKDILLKDHLTQHFLNVNDEYEILNIPPLRVYEAIK